MQEKTSFLRDQVRQPGFSPHRRRCGLPIAAALAVIILAPMAYAEIGKDSNALASGGDGKANPQATAAVQQYMAGPSVFIRNAGQWADDSIRFALDGSGANVGLTDQGPRFQLFRKTSAPSAMSHPSDPSDPSDLSAPAPSEMREFAVVFDGAAHVAPTGRGQADRTFNYLMGGYDGSVFKNDVWYCANGAAPVL